MPNQYSIEIHRYLSDKIAVAKQLIATRGKTDPNLQGQLDELLWIRKYLSEHIDLEDFPYY